MINDWTRMECTDGFSKQSEQLLPQLKSVNNTFINGLPLINSSIPVFPEQFNFSSE